MDRTTALIWSWLNVLTKKRYDALREVYGDLETALQHLDEKVLKGLSCREETVHTTLNRRDEFDVDAYEKELAKRDLQFLSIEDEEYPEQLKHNADAPVFLYYRGDLSVLNQPCIALVGTREMSAYGKRVTETFVPEFVRAGMVTVSGLALGIDAEVAKETLQAGGKTVAVLGHGLAMIYPKTNAKLADQIVEHGGLIISEFPLDAEPGKHTFPARNRVIAGLSLGTLVLEAGEGSGALFTAEFALEEGREVFAVPGQVFDPNYAGCHQLIAKGQAKLITSAAEVLQEFRIVAPDEQKESKFVPQTPEEEHVRKILTTMPQSVTELVERSGMEAGNINATLTMMELSGGAKNVGNGMWVRT